MKIHFLKLDCCSILPMLFFRAMGYKVYFLDCSPWLRKERLLAGLSSAGLIWLNFQDYQIKSGKLVLDWTENKARICAQICALESFQLLENLFDKKVVLQPCILQRVTADVFLPIQLLSIMRTQDNPDAPIPEERLIWLPNTLITRSLLEAYPGYSNRCPRVWVILELFSEVLGRVVGKLIWSVSTMLGRLFRSPKIEGEAGEPPVKGDSSFLQNAEIAYFPHQGVAFGKLFLKDHFYSSDKDNPFFQEKIAHFELGGNQASPASLEYYREKNINNYDWGAIPFDKKATVKCLLRFWGMSLINGFRGLDVDLLIKQTWIVWAIQTHKSRLEHLPNLKILLIGYDVLFPQTLCVACRLLGIKTVAVMERMYNTWWDLSLLFDHYFAIGPEAVRYLRNTRTLPGVHVHELGPVRLPDYSKAHVPDIMAAIRKEYSHVVLVMDFHSEKDWFQNGRAFDNNWRNNLSFYNVLIRACEDFPEAFFLLKSKNTDFIEVPFFKEMMGRFHAQRNLLLLEDQTLWTPFASVKAADIAVALYTSMVDEMLAFGKPIIIYDGLYEGYGIPTEVYDYGAEATAHNYNDIKDKLTRFFADPDGYNTTLDELRNKLFFVSDEPVAEQLHRELMNIWNAAKNGIAA